MSEYQNDNDGTRPCSRVCAQNAPRFWPLLCPLSGFTHQKHLLHLKDWQLSKLVHSIVETKKTKNWQSREKKTDNKESWRMTTTVLAKPAYLLWFLLIKQHLFWQCCHCMWKLPKTQKKVLTDHSRVSVPSDPQQWKSLRCCRTVLH